MRVKLTKTLAAKIFILKSFVSVFIVQLAQANMPVIDQTNLAQNIITATQNVAAVEKQIQQYQMQLQQYENMLKNTLAPPAYIWDQASNTINRLLQAQNTLDDYKNQLGTLDAYLSRYQDVDYYRTSPCFTDGRCTDAQRHALLDARAKGSQAQKRANDALLKSVDQQQQTLRTDAINLTQLQVQTTQAKGQMQALQAANQLASAQTHQLLQIRGLLIAQQNAAATRAQVVADREAQYAAGDEHFLSNSYTKSPSRLWKIKDGQK